MVEHVYAGLICPSAFALFCPQFADSEAPSRAARSPSFFPIQQFKCGRPAIINTHHSAPYLPSKHCELQLLTFGICICSPSADAKSAFAKVAMKVCNQHSSEVRYRLTNVVSARYGANITPADGILIFFNLPDLVPGSGMSSGDKPHPLARNFLELQRRSAKGYACPLCTEVHHQEQTLWDHALRNHQNSLGELGSTEVARRRQFRQQALDKAYVN